jgi:hypothetical protein
MKILSTAVLCMGLLTGAAHAANEVSVGASINAPEGEVNLSFFYESLAPHGHWHNDAKFGWVWQPQVVVTEREWRPYRDNGHWVWTDVGWYWESTYDWGWAPFHYGRWTYVDNLNWVWVPDVVWAPSWVVWRHSNDVYGWAPLPPGIEVGANIDFNVNINIGMNFYTFVPARRFLSANVATVALPEREVRTVFQQTKIVNNSYVVQNNTVINNGVPVQQVAQATGQQIKPVEVTSAEVKAGQPIPKAQKTDGKLAVYRPAVKKEAPKDPTAIKSGAAATKATDTKTGADAAKPQDAKSGADAAKPQDAKSGAKSQEATKPATGDRKPGDQSLSKPAPGQEKKDAATSQNKDAELQTKDEERARKETSFERNPNAATPAQPAEPARKGQPAQPAQPAEPSVKSKAEPMKPATPPGRSTRDTNVAPKSDPQERRSIAPKSSAPERSEPNLRNSENPPPTRSAPERSAPRSSGAEVKEPARDSNPGRSEVQAPGRNADKEPKQQSGKRDR